MMREYQVRICERLGVKFPGPTRQSRRFSTIRAMSAIPLIAAERHGLPPVADRYQIPIQRRDRMNVRFG
jgi:hypothetical protein